MSHVHLLAWILFAPLAAAVFNGLLALRSARVTVPVEGHHLRPIDRAVAGIGVAGPLVATLAAWTLAIDFLGRDRSLRLTELDLGTWFTMGQAHVSWLFRVDALSLVMVLIVTTVGTLIHLYSVGYMAGDQGFPRFFTWLNLFTFAMLVLVTARDLVVLFLGWEGVGVCSYLLIGYWFSDAAKAAAGLKAFVVNRIGDLGLLLGMFLLYWSMVPSGQASLDIDLLSAHVTKLSVPLATLAAVLLFIGAMGKSAQVPLHIWLPDAMAGPTPVSALIHAATMVTAGVYMVARMHPLYHHAPAALAFIGSLGALTALVAATVACTQTNIKRVIAWSTVSQLGYMFMGLGAGAFSVGIYHLFTHAFFKALFFLSAGAVIHALNGEEEVGRMGGLWSKLRITGPAFVIAAAANAGIPPLSGFVSKDAILVAAWHAHQPWWLAVGLLTAGMTAFYSFRLVALVLAGPARDKHLVEHAHEAGWTMTVPLLLLACGAVAAGALEWPHELGGTLWFSAWLEPVFYPSLAHGVHANPVVDLILTAGSVAVVATGAAVGWSLHARPGAPTGSPWTPLAGVWQAMRRGWFVDEALERALVRPVVFSSRAAAPFLDFLLGWMAKGVVGGLSMAGRGLAVAQSGLARHYAMAMLAGLVVLVAWAVLSGGR
ncbi:MAG: NADH-quinone oxidoreductase subunit L [Candidatus Sericytochromatia bacterium]|nr:NADH-quinone oxidoreductase subunit L [Candidatus Sericytochromatia bacterium]